ncbi:serine hydrolase domain-containing protein [Deinococcus koreensis]|uniref:Serine hydrolase n=1 Tax=Deinococcus koreensis TaxID=2054903 RepID=A0A2K3UZI3_9DEIO|nr:serine hydrolase domain-containing protein [Deinococcus koreensis]PNY81940.1 serine hydrolase [Deinococcus koreensis]
MFRKDPLKLALEEVAEVLGTETRPLLGLARSVYRRGGVLGVQRVGRRVVVGLGGVPAGGVFELASVTKPFTAALADALVRAGRLEWEAPLSRLGGALRRLPPGLNALNLATHTAGLPAHPARVVFTSMTRFSDPYGPLSVPGVLGSARRWARPGPQARFGYSNLGVGVLALALAQAAGEEVSAAGYGRALEGFVSGPLALGVALRPPANVVSPVSLLGGGNLTGFGPLAGAGGLFGPAADLLAFAQAHLDGRAGEHWQRRRHPPGLPPHLSGVAPGWFISGRQPDQAVWWHDGLARGTRTALGFCPASGASVVILARGGAPLLGLRSGVPSLLLALLGGSGGPGSV